VLTQEVEYAAVKHGSNVFQAEDAEARNRSLEGQVPRSASFANSLREDKEDMADQVLDAQGLSCPLPVLEAKKALKTMQAGATLQILATDPGAPADFQAFCRKTGNELLESKQEGNIYTCLIRRSA